jgi:hypothetical protein
LETINAVLIAAILCLAVLYAKIIKINQFMAATGDALQSGNVIIFAIFIKMILCLFQQN